MTRHPDCARCAQPAVMWSGAFGDPWVGWCSNTCKIIFCLMAKAKEAEMRAAPVVDSLDFENGQAVVVEPDDAACYPRWMVWHISPYASRTTS